MVTSSLNEISTDQLGNRVRLGGGGGVILFYPAQSFLQQASGQMFKESLTRDFLLQVFIMIQFPPGL
jgi:hypothetical protein